MEKIEKRTFTLWIFNLYSLRPASWSEADMKHKHMVKYYSLCWHQTLVTKVQVEQIESGSWMRAGPFSGWLGILRVRVSILFRVQGPYFLYCEMWQQPWERLRLIIATTKKEKRQNGAGKPAACSQDNCCFWTSFSSNWESLPAYFQVRTWVKGRRD